MRWIYCNLFKDFLPIYVSYRVRQITFLAQIPSNHLQVVQILRKPQTVKTWALLQRTLSAILLVLIRLVSSRQFFFTLLPFKATVEPKLTNISSKRTLPSDPVTCLLHSSQGLVGNTEQARSARAGDKGEAQEGDDGNECRARAWINYFWSQRYPLTGG